MAELRAHIEHEMGLTRDLPVVIIGVGNLGHALAGYGGLSGRGFEVVGDHVVLENDEVGNVELAQESGVDVGGNDLTRRGDLARKPCSDGSLAGAHLQAAPSFGDSYPLEEADRRGILYLLLQRDPAASGSAIFVNRAVSRHKRSSYPDVPCGGE